MLRMQDPDHLACRDRKIVLPIGSLFICLVSMAATSWTGESFKWGKKVPSIALVKSDFVS